MTSNEENLSNIFNLNDMTNSSTATSQTKYGKVTNEKRATLVRLVYETGQSIKDASAILEMNYNTARTIITKYEKTGIINQALKGGKNITVLTDSCVAKIEEAITLNPQFTLKEIEKYTKDFFSSYTNIFIMFYY